MTPRDLETPEPEGDEGPVYAPAAELAPGTMVGEYRIERRIGEGGMSTVYGAIHPVIGKKAALKVLRPELSVHPEAVERFLGEARAVNQIGHPNIVDVFSFGALPDGRRYFAMEWLHGESLARRVDREGGVALADALPILDQIAVALQAAHARGIVHRDLKPDNVFLCEVRGEPPRVKLLDFGIAKLLGEPLAVKRTKTGTLMGTPGYIAPEQARGEDVDARADVYALGCLAFELVTGQLPFESPSAMVVITKHLTESPPAPSRVEGCEDVPPELDALVTAMLAKDRAERPSLDEVRARLGSLRAKVATTPASAPRPRRAKGLSRAPTTPAGEVMGRLGEAAVTAAAGPAARAALATTASPAHRAQEARARSPRWLWWALGVAVVTATAVLVARGGGRGARRAASDSARASTTTTTVTTTPPLADPSGPPPGPTPGDVGATGAPLSPPAPPAPPSLPAPSGPTASPGELAVTVTGARAPSLVLDGTAQPGGADGTWTLRLPPGPHVVEVSARGVRTERRTVEVVSDQRRTTTIALAPERSGGRRLGADDGATAPRTAPSPGTSPPAPGGAADDDDALIDPFDKKRRAPEVQP